MKLIGFIGYSEKVDLVCSYAKVLQTLGKTVLVIDGTNEKKYKYAIESIENIESSYLIQYDSIDYAVGFESMNDVENYLCDNKVNISLYDYIIVDLDSEKKYEFFANREFEKKYFVFDTSMIALKKNKEIINAMQVYSKGQINENKVKKILYRGYITRAYEKYFNNELNALDSNFDENYIEIMEDEQDKMLFLDSLLSGYMNIKKHSRNFVMTLIELIREVEEEYDVYTLRRIIKKGGI